MADTETVPDKVQINVIRCKGLVTDMFKFPFLQNKSKILSYKWLGAEAYSEPCQTSEMECFVKIVNGKESFTIFSKLSILDF